MDNINNPNSTLTSSLSQPIISPNDTCIPQLKVSDDTNKTIYTIPMPAVYKIKSKPHKDHGINCKIKYGRNMNRTVSH